MTHQGFGNDMPKFVEEMGVLIRERLIAPNDKNLGFTHQYGEHEVEVASEILAMYSWIEADCETYEDMLKCFNVHGALGRFSLILYTREQAY